MKLKKFKISNFRSIINTKCEVTPRITILAGKNESGKTNILEALEITSQSEKYTDFDIPNRIRDAKPTVILFFESDDSDLKDLKDYLRNLNLSYNIALSEFSKLKSKPFTITDRFEENTFSLEGQFYSETKKLISEHLQTSLKKYNRNLATLKKKHTELNEFDFLKPFSAQIDDTISTFLKLLIANSFTQINQKYPNINIDILKSISSDIRLLKNAIDELNQVLYKNRPSIILYSSFDDIIPYSIPISEIKNKETFDSKYRIVKDLFKLANLDISIFDSENDQQRSMEVKRASKICSRDFSKYWKQIPIEISFEDKGDHLCIWINDEGREDSLLRPEQRSKGFKWYLSFFIRLKSEGIENSIILIDEPGANLHAKAQEEVLDLLEEISNKNQIIFTTHSPFLIDTKKLWRVRLVERENENKETIIENNFNKGSDYDTLTPIITKIGLDLTKTLTFSTEMNILLEGVSDYYYLVSMLDYLKKNEDYDFPNEYSFIPAIGHTQISHLISILFGWGLEYLILLDRKGTRKTHNKLVREGIDDIRIILIGKTNSESIEDLFAISDKKKYKIDILEHEKKTSHEEEKLSKSLTAKLFAQKTLEKDFAPTKTTLDNYKKIFDLIKKNIQEIQANKI